MKIGILTQPLQNNYGGLLQNYALQKVLRGLGHEVYTINLTSKKRTCSSGSTMRLSGYCPGLRAEDSESIPRPPKGKPPFCSGIREAS
jgi:hypothetical protein